MSIGANFDHISDETHDTVNMILGTIEGTAFYDALSDGALVIYGRPDSWTVISVHKSSTSEAPVGAFTTGWEA